MNENLRAIQKELNAKKRETEELAKQVRQMKLKPKAERLVTAIISNDDVCKALEHFTNAEVDVIAETFVSNFDQTLAPQASEALCAERKGEDARKRIGTLCLHFFNGGECFALSEKIPRKECR